MAKQARSGVSEYSASFDRGALWVVFRFVTKTDSKCAVARFGNRVRHDTRYMAFSELRGEWKSDLPEMDSGCVLL
jgi:hypothetical protein